MANPSALLNCNLNSDFHFMPLVSTHEAHGIHFAKKALCISMLKLEVSATQTSTIVTNDSIHNKNNISPASACSFWILIKQSHATLRSIKETSGTTAGGPRCVHHEGRFETKLQSGKVCLHIKISYACFCWALKLKCTSIFVSTAWQSEQDPMAWLCLNLELYWCLNYAVSFDLIEAHVVIWALVQHQILAWHLYPMYYLWVGVGKHWSSHLTYTNSDQFGISPLDMGAPGSLQLPKSIAKIKTEHICMF